MNQRKPEIRKNLKMLRKLTTLLLPKKRETRREINPLTNTKEATALLFDLWCQANGGRYDKYRWVEFQSWLEDQR